jgi:hypothetical protein
MSVVDMKESKQQLPKRKVGGARPGAGRKDPRKGIRRNYQFDYETVDMLDYIFPVPHVKVMLNNGVYKTRSRFINDLVREGCEKQLGVGS